MLENGQWESQNLFFSFKIVLYQTIWSQLLCIYKALAKFLVNVVFITEDVVGHNIFTTKNL